MAGVSASAGNTGYAGITYDPIHGFYQYGGQNYPSLEAAERAMAGPSGWGQYNPETQTYNPIGTAQRVQYTNAAGQTVVLPSIVDTTGGGSGGSGGSGGGSGGSLGSLASAAGYSSGADTDLLSKKELLKLQQDFEAAQAKTAAQNARDILSQQEGFAGSQAANAAALERELAAATRAAAQATQERDEAFQKELDRQKNAEALAAQDKMLSLIQPYLLGLTGTGTGTTPATDTTAQDALAQKAQTAAFGRAKDQTADLARSSLMALRAASAERGVNVAGGTNPALTGAEGRLIERSQAPLSNLVAQQAQDTSDRAQTVADRDYQGNITVQGQNKALAPSLLSLLKVGGLY